MNDSSNDLPSVIGRVQFAVYFAVFTLLYAVTDFGLVNFVHGLNATRIIGAQALLHIAYVVLLTPLVTRRLRHFQGAPIWVLVLWAEGVFGLRNKVLLATYLTVDPNVLPYIMFGVEIAAILLFLNLVLRPGRIVDKRKPIPIQAYSEF